MSFWRGGTESQRIVKAGGQDKIGSTSSRNPSFLLSAPSPKSYTENEEEKDQLHLYVPNHPFTQTYLNTKTVYGGKKSTALQLPDQVARTSRLPHLLAISYSL